MRTLGLFLLAASLLFPHGPVGYVSAQARDVYLCPMHPAVTSTQPGSCPQCGMRLTAKPAKEAGVKPKTAAKRVNVRGRRGARAAAPLKSPSGVATPNTDAPQRDWASLSPAERARELERLAPTYEYSCMMHPEVRLAQEGSCSRCGMVLMSLQPSFRGAYKLDVISEPARPLPGRDTRLRFVVTDPRTGRRVREFVNNHERLFHLFVVSRDMSVYQHIHPRHEPDGSFSVETVLPRAGLYRLYADFFPAGGTIQVLSRDLPTAGYRATGAPRPAALTPDATLTKTVDGTAVSLELGGGEPAPGALIPLKYRLADARTGEPVRDLEPYLGAWGHTLILSADQSEYLHSHPTGTLPDGPGRAALRGGPVVEFRAMFPTPGVYRIWTQFQRAGRVATVSFTLRVKG